MCGEQDTGWERVSHAARRMFNVWVGGSELAWAKEAWRRLHTSGLASDATILEDTASKLRLVALARIYEEFCGLAWDENPETPLNYLAEDLDIDALALGVLAGGTEAELEDEADEYKLREAALVAVTNHLRRDVFQCLESAYGGFNQLYSRLWCTSPSAAVTEEDEPYAIGEEFEATPTNAAALSYVMNGFRYG